MQLKYLPKIKTPEDLKKLDAKALHVLCEIIGTTVKSGIRYVSNVYQKYTQYRRYNDYKLQENYQGFLDVVELFNSAMQLHLATSK